MNIQILDPTQIPNWDSLVLRHPSATPFHSSGWARVLQETYGFTPLYACVFKGETLSSFSFHQYKRGKRMEKEQRPHKKLEVWKNSMELARIVYKITGSFPASELYGN